MPATCVAPTTDAFEWSPTEVTEWLMSWFDDRDTKKVGVSSELRGAVVVVPSGQLQCALRNPMHTSKQRVIARAQVAPANGRSCCPRPSCTNRTASAHTARHFQQHLLQCD